jgi:hypothetical protein
VNKQVYGTKRPLNYLEHYHLIDIPISFFISMNDMLIRADDIIEHFNTLKQHHPHLARVKLFEGFSHIDFTYGCHHTLTTELINTLKQFNTDTHTNTNGLVTKSLSIIKHSLDHIDEELVTEDILPH